VNQELLNFIGLHCHIYTDDFGVLSQDQLLHTKRHAEKSCVTCSKHTTWSRSKKMFWSSYYWEQADMLNWTSNPLLHSDISIFAHILAFVFQHW